MRPAKIRVVDPLAPDDPRHGTTNAYTNLGCRCDACRRANSDRQRAYRHAKAKEAQLPPDDPRHGTDNAYTNYRCRCKKCVKQHQIARRMRKLLKGK